MYKSSFDDDKRTIDLIIAYYNGSAYIKQAIESAMNQSHPFSRIILVDDGSTLEEKNYVQKICLNYGVEYFSQENTGQGGARNYGVQLSNAKYVCFLDQDDVLLPDHNLKLFNAINGSGNKNIAWVFGNLVHVDEKLNFVARKIFPHRHHPFPNNIFEWLGRDLHMLPSATIVLKEAFDFVGGFDAQFRGYEDDDLFVRMFRAGFECAFLDEEVYLWRHHVGQTSASPLMWESRIKFIRKWMAEFDDFSSKKHLVDRFIIRFENRQIFDVMNCENLGNKNISAKTSWLDYMKLVNPYLSLVKKIKYLYIYYAPIPVLKKTKSIYAFSKRWLTRK